MLKGDTYGFKWREHKMKGGRMRKQQEPKECPKCKNGTLLVFQKHNLNYTHGYKSKPMVTHMGEIHKCNNKECIYKEFKKKTEARE